MFADIDRDGNGTVDRNEMALYIMKLIEKKNDKAVQSEYMTKLAKLEEFI